MKKEEIVINPEKCTGCKICMLYCSYLHFKKFIPSEARIRIENEYGLIPTISFLDECTNCGQCALHCPYGALIIKEVES